MASDILIIDDEMDIRDIIADILEDEGYETRLARNSDEALDSVLERRPSLVILDIWLQGSRLDGLEILSILKQQHPDLPVIMISGHGNIETAVSAIQMGAYDYIEKPFQADRLLLITARAIENSKLIRENKELKERSLHGDELIGSSFIMGQLQQQIEKVAPTNSRIMITGDSGSGKELVARIIHQKSERSEGPFVALNAAIMEPDRVEEELFGIEEAKNGVRKVGALEESHGGTLYIDEVADMPLETQGKILRVLVEQKFLRLGGTEKVKVDVRIISSTSHNLQEMMEQKLFRSDLYHRLNVVPLKIPPLTTRREDIPELINYFVKQITLSSGLVHREIGEDAVAGLQSYDWPGNVRQLRNTIERMMIMADGEGPISSDMIPEDICNTGSMPNKGSGGEHMMSLKLREAREIFEREFLVAQINRFGGNISRTAEFVGMERSALHRKLRALGIGSSERKNTKVS